MKLKIHVLIILLFASTTAFGASFELNKTPTLKKSGKLNKIN